MEFGIINTIKCLTLFEFPTNETITVDAVRSQYRKLGLIYHPDQSNKRYQNGERFKDLNDAKEYLINNIDRVNRQIATNFATYGSASSGTDKSFDYAKQQENARRREEAMRRAAEEEALKWKRAAEKAQRAAEEERKKTEEAKKKAEEARKAAEQTSAQSGRGSSDIKWLHNRIQAIQKMPPKKMTGTRFATVLGRNPFSTPFEVWCAITHTYEVPFEENKYTKAGKILEPKQLAYIIPKFRGTVVTPSDLWGENYFNKTLGDFFADTPIFGGMWDYLLKSGDKTLAVFEMKTTNSKNRSYWTNTIPDQYALQAALYAYLLGVDQVYMVVSFLSDDDYVRPGSFQCSESNTQVVPFKMAERYPCFQDSVEFVVNWWNAYVKTGMSPYYAPNNRKDLQIINELKKT